MNSNDKKRGSEKGIAIVLVLIFILVLAPLLTGMLVNLSTSTTHMSMVSRSLEDAYQIAEGGVNATLFRVEANVQKNYGGSLQNFLAANNNVTFKDSLNGGDYTATIKGPVTVNGDSEYFTITCTGRSRLSRSRTVEALVHGPTQPKALDYSLCGNFVHFDNHNKVPLGITMVSSVYSNSSILVDGGVIIDGPIIAVEDVRPNTGPACNPNCPPLVPSTIFPQAALQGNSNPTPFVPTAIVKTMSPVPPVLPYPTFDFAKAKSIAQANGTYFTPKQMEDLIDEAEKYASTLNGANYGIAKQLPGSKYPGGISVADVPVDIIRRNNTALIKNNRFISLPTPLLPFRTIPLGSPDGLLPPSTDTIEIILHDNRGNSGSIDQVFYIDGKFELKGNNRNTLIRVEGSLIVNGEFNLKAAVELLPWENTDLPTVVPLNQTLYNFTSPIGSGVDIRHSRYPALAVNGPIKIEEKDKGPVHIEGVVYSTDELHLHHDNISDSIYLVGNETADIVHVCQYASLFYDPEARKVLGFANRTTGRTEMALVRLDAK